MLLVPTRIGASTIHGLGLFATEPIPAGTLVQRFEPGFDLDLDAAAVAVLPDFQRAFFLRFAYAVPGRAERLRCALDNARFLNHSDAPNLVIDGERTFAARSVLAGEELTHDYRALTGARSVPFASRLGD